MNHDIVAVKLFLVVRNINIETIALLNLIQINLNLIQTIEYLTQRLKLILEIYFIMQREMRFLVD